ncbi:ROK family protein [Rhizosphaericola mali]|uniref:ROK family protein n=1 Tax=Rhizosphaericola mali TaxID=2545455 RepID=A0A5P2G707_9BACT|nr:ROK family protein [Rhizosphaericola mali]QES89722.1 ROK family protein [Rhizosphaericola mali]
MGAQLNELTLKKEIIKLLYYDKRLSCAELSNVLGKSIPIVTKAITSLIQEEWVEESGLATSTGGRRPMEYTLKANERYILSISMDRLFTQIALFDLHNSPVTPIETHALPLYENPASLNQLISIINSFIQKHNHKERIIGIGIASPGFINKEKGIHHSYLQTPDGATLTEHLERQLGLPVYLDNDSSVIALAELRFGKAKEVSDSMVVNIGWGIGLGMIIDHKIFRGSFGLAGEFSHIPISESDLLCECGKRGCLETEGTLLVVAEKAQRLLQKGDISGIQYSDNAFELSQRLMDAANRGNQDAIAMFSDMGSKIGKALSILIHIINPAQIILSGRGAEVGRLLLAPIQQALNTYCIPKLFENSELVISDLGKGDVNVELIGAAALVMDMI